jgi:hypothetical protein
MRKLKIGYWPLSSNLKSPGDRRRVVFWAEARGHSIVTDLTQNVDAIVVSENSDFNSAVLAQREIPVILDLVDAYLSPLNPIDDLARGLVKKVSGQISGGLKPFSHHIRDVCLSSRAVICSSLEQEAVIKPYNKNTHIILDSHDEIPFIKPSVKKKDSNNEIQVLWEGQPATIRGVKSISPVLSELSKTNNLRLNFVTDQKYFRILNKYFEGNTLNLLKKDLNDISALVHLIPWATDNLIFAAQESSIAMIPIDLTVPMQRLKPENRLLIMWRLGLPCLTSSSPAYVRVERLAGVNAVSTNLETWLFNFNRLLEDPSFAKEEVLRGQNYLHEFHTREILLKKWDLAFDSVMG